MNLKLFHLKSVVASLALLMASTSADAVSYIVRKPLDRLPAQPAGTPSMADGDGDDCTLRKAMENINAGYVKYKDCAPFPNFGKNKKENSKAPSRIIIDLPDVSIAIPLKGPLTLLANKNLIIDGNGAALDGRDLTRILEMNAGPTKLEVYDLEFTRGNGLNGGGGAIKIGSSTASLVLEDTLFTYNVASQGGAIHSAGSVVIYRSDFFANKATSPTIGTGGAIFAGGLLEIYGERLPGPVSSFTARSQFEGNKAELGGGGVHCSSGIMRATKTEFRANETIAQVGSYGGGGLLNGSGIGTGGCELHLHRVEFDSNTARGYGGAIRTSTTSDVLISRSVFDKNKSSLVLFGGPHPDVGGGGIFTDGSLEVAQSSFTDNSSTSMGGAILVGNTGNNPVSVANSTFAGNRATLGIMTIANEGAAIAVHGNAKGAVVAGTPVGVLIYNNTIVDIAASSQVSISGPAPNLQPKVRFANNLSVYADGASACTVAPGAEAFFVGNVESPGNGGVATCSPSSTIVPDPGFIPASPIGWPRITFFFPLAAGAVNVGDAAVCAAPPVNGVDIRGVARGTLCLAGSVTL